MCRNTAECRGAKWLIFMSILKLSQASAGLMAPLSSPLEIRQQSEM